MSNFTTTSHRVPRLVPAVERLPVALPAARFIQWFAKKKGLLFRQVLTEANCDDNAVVPFNVNHEIAWCPKRIKSDLEDFVDFSWRVSEIYRRTGVGYHLSFFCVLRDP